MIKRVARKLDFIRKRLLSVAGSLIVAVPLVLGIINAAQSQAQSPAKSTAQDISGTWQGTLQAGRGLRTVIKISKADDGAWKAVLYSIDQGGQPSAVTSITLAGSAVNFSIKGMDVTYVGTLNPDGNSIAGSWTRSGQTQALNLEHVTEEDAWAIPEPPKRMAADANPEFEVATIKPSDPSQPGRAFTLRGRHVITINMNMNDLITIVYDLHAKQIVGGPAWFGTDKFDIDGVPDVEGQPNQEQAEVMLQKLLADRFKLTFHRDKQELSVYALVVGKDGPKLTKSADPNGLPGLMFRGPGVLPARNATMADLAGVMQRVVLDRPVVDQTGLKGRFDFELKWTPDESQYGGRGIQVPPPVDNADAPPDLFTAIQEQIGLKLESTKAPVDVLVIDHVEKPSPN